MGFTVMDKLNEALRQYRHNNSDEFVFGYDKDAIDRLVAELEAQLKEEKLQHGLTKISLDHRTTHLNSCEVALHLRDNRIESLEKWLRELIVDVDTEDFANLDIETTLDTYGLPPIMEKESHLPPKDWDEFESDAMLSTTNNMKKGKYDE